MASRHPAAQDFRGGEIYNETTGSYVTTTAYYSQPASVLIPGSDVLHWLWDQASAEW